ncbi:hypothetical protein Forpe1208_v012735 [Fusarium oxysporum f. sp. rapae]|uniref:Uncharacterized protein n=1 Tax=Fusarium oxysporum f. sp. rapae TaxID=485398 RepID=A0A8J5U0U6_FUSOX|nr:hypothetical protein Forpe1208_v012735 [Fusarium oxysporum f. sp. rapae]
MSDVVSVRLRWRLLKALHPVFYVADTFPTTDDVAVGRFGTLSEFDKTQLERVITALRSEFEYNIMRRETLDVGKFISDGTKWTFLATSLKALLRDLEHLTHRDIYRENRVEVSKLAYRLSGVNALY